MASVCFKHGPPRLLGVELEWLRAQRRPLRHAPAGSRGAAQPRSARTPRPRWTPRSPALPLPGRLHRHRRARWPGRAGQPAASRPRHARCAPSPPTPRCCTRLAAHGLRPQPRAADPVRPPRRVLDLPRYRAMEQCFDRIGPYGRSAHVLHGRRAGLRRRRRGRRRRPPLGGGARARPGAAGGVRELAAAARTAHGLEVLPAGPAGCALDPARTAPPPVVHAGRPGRRLGAPGAAPPAAVRAPEHGSWQVPEPVSPSPTGSPGRFTRRRRRHDLDYHVSTLFPPVRPHGHLEVRYVDAQPGRRWALPVAVLAALLSDPDVTDRARHALRAGRGTVGLGRAPRPGRPGAAPARPSRCSSWPRAPARPRRARLARRRPDRMTERGVRRGRSPADDPDPAS